MVLRARVIAACVIAAAGNAAAEELDAGQVRFQYGGTALLGAAGFAADSTAPGDAGWRRARAQGLAYLMVRGSAETGLDDGSTLGLFVRLRPYENPGERTDVPPDRDELVKDAYLRWKGAAFGEFRLGIQADIRQNEALGAPQICGCLDGFFGSSTPGIAPMHGPLPANTTGGDLDQRAAKLAWYSPALDGFRLGLDYGPFRSDGRPLDGRLALLDTNYATPGGVAGAGGLRDAQVRNAWSAAGWWNGTRGETAIGVEAGASGGTRGGPVVQGLNDRDPLVWGGGFSVGYAAWKFGAAFEQQDAVDLEGIYGAAAYRLAPGSLDLFQLPATNDIVTRTVDLGFTYSIGPVTAGLAWSRGIYEGLVDPADAKHTADNDVVFGGVQYQVTRWADILGGMQWNHYDPGGTPRPLPAAAGLSRVYGGADPTLNPFARGYDGVALVLGVALRL